jgi:hypothetical protein
MCHDAIGWEVFPCLDLAEVVDEGGRDWIRDSHTTIALLHIMSPSILLRLKCL